jgi:hypothetical protein
MAYEYEELESLALEAIKKHRLPKISYVVAYIPCSNTTFYERNLNKSDILKEEVYKNRIERKLALVNKMEESDSASAQIAVLKLLADEEEFNRLAGSQIDHTTKGQAVTGFEIVAPDED